jgi:hypothetical protein
MAVHFYCESCGAEVKLNAKICPKCGRFFASVRCPACGHIGGESAFVRGCPACGYLPPVGGNAGVPGSGTHHHQVSKLPAWVYVLSVLGLVIVGVLFFAMRV